MRRALAKAMKNVFKSSAVKSTRRIHFTHLDEDTESRGYYHADQFFGTGSCILIKMNHKYFLLTAKHVLENNHVRPPYQNESPFWIAVKSNARIKNDTLDDWFMPAKLWNISELMSTEMKSSYVDICDIALIELFPPNKNSLPDNFINLSKESDVLASHQLEDGLCLCVSGYPNTKNTYQYDSPPEGFTHHTTTQRLVAQGIYTEEVDSDFGYISFEESEFDCSNHTITGMSGGVVTNIELKNTETKLAGMSVSGGSNIIRFIPAFTFIKAVLNYEAATSEKIDPILKKDHVELFMELDDEGREALVKFHSTRAY